MYDTLAVIIGNEYGIIPLVYNFKTFLDIEDIEKNMVLERRKCDVYIGLMAPLTHTLAALYNVAHNFGLLTEWVFQVKSVKCCDVLEF